MSVSKDIHRISTAVEHRTGHTLVSIQAPKPLSHCAGHHYCLQLQLLLY
uniref:Uncharacterized protein n=1 Tax=Ciona intestinalis TaxID=7719 RepID=H2XXS8_CIOIN